MSGAVIAWLRQQSFALLLFAAVGLAFIWPDPVVAEQGPRADALADAAVAVIFLLQGLSLGMRQILAGARPLRLHAFVLGWNFLFFPALVALLLLPVRYLIGPELSGGLWMLAILPTTIASATALTVAASGGPAAAICASVFSNLLAVVLVPLLAVAYLSSTGGLEVALLPVFEQLARMVLLPLASGQLVRQAFPAGAQAIGARTRRVPQAAILYIVYLSFAQTLDAGVWESLAWWQLTSIGLLVVLLLLLVSWLVWQTSAWMRFNSGQRIAAFYTASQKSIATGLPLLSAIFAAASWPVGSGLLLLPLLIYHPLQLLLGGLLVPGLAKGATKR